MQAAAAAQALGRWLALRHQALPLREALPGVRVEPGFFDVLLARWEGGDLIVHALLADPGSDAYEAGRRAEALRMDLEAAAQGVPGRVRAAVHCVTEEAPRAQRLREALMDHADGHFLSKVLVGRSVLCLKDHSAAYSGRGAVSPDAAALTAALSDEAGLPGEAEGEHWLHQREKEQRSLRRLLSPGPKPLTWALLAANVAFFGLELWKAHQVRQHSAVSADTARFYAQLALGANYPEAVFGQGQWWRLLAAAFLHVNELHLAVNMATLFSLGALCEKILGPWRFLAFYLTAALGSSLLSALLIGSGGVSMGASGALMGLAGLLMAPKWRRHKAFSAVLAQRLHQWLLNPVLLTLGIGFAFKALDLPLQFDNGAHLGGLCYGLALGYLFPSFLVRPVKRQG